MALEGEIVAFSWAVLPPSEVVTVMVAEPALTPVTLPLLSTVATAVLDEAQLTALLLASAGETVAVRLSLAPSLRVTLALLTLTPDTEISAGSF